MPTIIELQTTLNTLRDQATALTADLETATEEQAAVQAEYDAHTATIDDLNAAIAATAAAAAALAAKNAEVTTAETNLANATYLDAAATDENAAAPLRDDVATNLSDFASAFVSAVLAAGLVDRMTTDAAIARTYPKAVQLSPLALRDVVIAVKTAWVAAVPSARRNLDPNDPGEATFIAWLSEVLAGPPSLRPRVGRRDQLERYLGIHS
jgi:hypothetical protein